MEMTTYRTKAEWNEIVEAYQKSGQTMRTFCEERGLSPKTLGSHVKNPIKYEPVSRSMEEWIPLLDEQKASGLPKSRWCREHEISESALRAAERRLQPWQGTDPDPKWVELAGDEVNHGGIFLPFPSDVPEPFTPLLLRAFPLTFAGHKLDSQLLAEPFLRGMRLLHLFQAHLFQGLSQQLRRLLPQLCKPLFLHSFAIQSCTGWHTPPAWSRLQTGASSRSRITRPDMPSAAGTDRQFLP